jgi:hypothetical protein
MGKRRTRKQKEKAKHKFLYQWPQAEEFITPQLKEASSEPAVNRQIVSTKRLVNHKNIKNEKAAFTDNVNDLASIRKNIGKSVILASLILSLELVIYLIWR